MPLTFPNRDRPALQGRGQPFPGPQSGDEPSPPRRPFHRKPRLGVASRFAPWLAFIALLCGPALAPAADLKQPSARPAVGRYEFHAQHDPDGIGKFYMGREIAQVMGHQGADWLERPERAEEEHSDELIELLKLKPGDVVADIGAGTGYYSRRLARKVGPAGRVLAEDIQPEMLALLTNQMAGLGISNVTPILGTVADPKLAPRSVDAVLMVDVYHEFEFPYEMMSAVCAALKPGGRVIFVEFRAEDPKVPVKAVHKMSEAQVKKEMAVQPLVWSETIESLPRQHIIIFRRRSESRL